LNAGETCLREPLGLDSAFTTMVTHEHVRQVPASPDRAYQAPERNVMDDIHLRLVNNSDTCSWLLFYPFTHTKPNGTLFQPQNLLLRLEPPRNTAFDATPDTVHPADTYGLS
jgi:hypothetical protein